MPPSVASFPPCRNHDLFWPLERYPALLARNPADELLWFKWDHSFGGEAIIRIARVGAEVLVSRFYRVGHFGKTRCRSARLRLSDWALLEDAVVAADFWMLDESGGARGCDGAEWVIAGRRRHDYHLVKRWSPDDGLFDLGRLMFDLVGLDEARL